MSFISGEVYACNITNNYLVMSKKQPMLYINVRWTKYKFAKPILYTLCLYFTIETEVKSSEELLKKPLCGKFSLEVHIGNQQKQLDKKIDKFPGNDEIVETLVDFTQTDEMKNLLKNLVEIEEEKRRDQYAKEFEQYKTMPKATVCLKDYLEDD